jgi:hypothetical protein
MIAAATLTITFAGAVEARVPGGGSKKTDCYAEFDGITPKRGTRVECTDGDPSCDTDGLCQGTCTFRIRVCAKQSSPPRCDSPNVTGFKRNTLGLSLPQPLPITSPTCGAYTNVAVGPIRGKQRLKSRKGRLVTQVDGRPKSDGDTVTLVCRKRNGECPLAPVVPCDLPACAPERVTLTSGAGGTLTVSVLPPFPFPSGVLTVLDVDTAVKRRPDVCYHPVTIPAFSVPVFPIPALGYCSQVTTTGCASGSGGLVGAGTLWDGMAPAGLADSTVLTKGDTQDGVCDTTGAPACDANAPHMNSTGDIDLVTSPSTSAGVRSLIEIPVKSLTWSEQGCITFADPNCQAGGDPQLCCCLNSVFDPVEEPGDAIVTNFNFVLRPSTDMATAQFADKNGDGCFVGGSGPPGPVSETGTPAAGPCCVVGQTTTVASAGVAFTGGAPLYDLLFSSVIPNTITACDGFGGAGVSCTVATDPCAF